MADTTTKDRYQYAVGRRKTASAQVRVWPAKKIEITVNGVDFRTYFPTNLLQDVVMDPFKRGDIASEFKISVLVKGGGIHGQAEAVRHGITRAIVEMDQERRVGLKKLGFLKRDPRKKERKKPGLKKARKAGQWSKR